MKVAFLGIADEGMQVLWVGSYVIVGLNDDLPPSPLPPPPNPEIGNTPIPDVLLQATETKRLGK